MRQSDDSSRIGFRINEDLGGGLRAFSVIETGINIDTATANGQSGAANSGAGFIGTREAHVGIGNGYAEVRLGRQNVFWANGKIEDVSANLIHGGVTSAYTAPGSGWINTPAARVDNTTKIVFNKDLVGTMFAGSEVWYAIGTKAEQTPAGADDKAKSMGFTVKAAQGPFAAQIDYGQNKNGNNGVPTPATSTLGQVYDSTITGTKLGLAYFYLPTSKISFIHTQLKQEFSDATNANNQIAVNASGLTSAIGFRKQSSNAFGIQHDLGGGNMLIGQYVLQDDMKDYTGASVGETGSKAYTLAYRKELSKRTSLSAAYTRFDNDAKNNMLNAGGGQAAVATGPMGGTVTMVGVGIMHNF